MIEVSLLAPVPIVEEPPLPRVVAAAAPLPQAQDVIPLKKKLKPKSKPKRTSDVARAPAPAAPSPVLKPAAVAAPEVQQALPVTAARFNAEYLHNPRPPYPELAKRRGWEGRVLLLVRVSPAGHCASVAVQNSSGYDILDATAAKTVTAWRFIPAKRGEQPITSDVTVPIIFRLDS
jgi:protein TonB